MGVFNFISEIGKAAAAAVQSPSAEDLKKELDSHKLGTENIDVSVNDGKVSVKGKVKDRETLEKAVLALGNTKGIGEVDTDGITLEDSTTDESAFYTVKSGDNLWKIAEAHYGKGNGDKNDRIFEANRPMLTSPDKIYPGQVLRIPPLK